MREETISAAVVRGLIHIAAEAGVSREELLRGIELELESRHARVPRATAEVLCLRAMALTGDLALGLHWAEHLSQSSFGLVAHLSAAAPSLRQALHTLSRFSAFFSDQPFFALREHEQLATIEVLGFTQQPLDLYRFAAELAVGGFVRVVRFTWPGTKLTSIDFSYPAPDHRDEYERVFKQAPAFEQAFTGLTFDRALLDAPSPLRDDALAATIAPLVNQRMAESRPGALYAPRVRECLEQRAPLRVTMAAVAHDLGLSARSLRRKLSLEEVTFTDIEEQVLGSVAAKLLQEPNNTIQQVADRMGFSTPATFHRAFRRWTGTTPRVLQDRRVK